MRIYLFRGLTERKSIMKRRQQSQPAQRAAETAEIKEKEGHGTVPNVTPNEAEGEMGELAEAVHQLEEDKGDWSKDR